MPRQSTKAAIGTANLAKRNQLPKQATGTDDDTLLTDQQDTYARLYVEYGANALLALREAGYNPKDETVAKASHVQLASKPHVIRAIRKYQKAAINGELATLAVNTVKEILLDREANPRVRLEAAKVAMDKAGIADLNFEDQSQLQSLSLDTLKDLLSQTKHALGDLETIENDPRLLGPVIDGEVNST